MKVKVNYSIIAEDVGQINSMSDLVEFVKAQIDPEEIITQLTLNGNILSDVDWRVPLSVHGDAILEVMTGGKAEYLEERFGSATSYVEEITAEFATARESFKNNNQTDGNAVLKRAVEDFNAFLGWYSTLLSMLPETHHDVMDTFLKEVTTINGTCENLLKQQMYQSWWAMSDTLEKELEPQLGNLKTKCSEVASMF